MGMLNDTVRAATKTSAKVAAGKAAKNKPQTVKVSKDKTKNVRPQKAKHRQ